MNVNNREENKEEKAYAYLMLMLQRHPELNCIRKSVEDAYEIVKNAYSLEKKLLVCGNGGSASDSLHIVGELMKGFRVQRHVKEEDRKELGDLADDLQGALPAIALTSELALISAFGNDVNPEMIYAQQVYGYGVPGDVFLGITTSGNSMNVLKAAETARKRGLKTIGLTGKTGGKMADLADVCIEVPQTDTAFVQEEHIVVYHTLCSMLEAYFFDEL